MQQFIKTLTLLREEPSKTIVVGDSWWRAHELSSVLKLSEQGEVGNMSRARVLVI